jgi:hypothetical protein
MACSDLARSQDLKSNYKPCRKYEPEKTYMQRIYGSYDSLYKSLSYTERKEGKTVKEALEETKKTLTGFESSKVIMQKDTITRFLQNIVNQIQQKNPLLKDKRYSIFTYRTIVPNAANYGSGVILFNLNLLAKFASEENVAFILCHEIAHDLKGHVIEGIRQAYELQSNPAFKEQFKKIEKQEFNKYKSYEAYAAKYLSVYTSKKRAHEIEADALGLTMYLKAGYNKELAYETMERLDSADQEIHKGKIDYEKFFSNGDGVFKKQWLEFDKEESLDGGNLKDVKYPDSLKTHPDCKKRLAALKDLDPEKGTALVRNYDYSDLHYAAQFEMLEVYREEFELSKGLYNTLQLATLYPDNRYLKCAILDYLYEIYMAKTQHYMSLCIDDPEKDVCGSYAECINFVTNINSESLKNLMEQYFKKNFSTSLNDPYEGYIFMLLKSLNKTKEEKFLLNAEYEKTFGKNEYHARLSTKFLKPK